MKTRVKELRLSRKMSQRALGNIVNCSQNYISQVELEQALPRADVLVAIANYFGVSVDYLLCLTNQRYRIELNSSSANKQVEEYAKKLLGLSNPKRQIVNSLIDVLLDQSDWE